MKIISINGGLGNQMFQYALAISIKAHSPEEIVLIDTSPMKGYKLHNGFELDKIFNLEIPFASFKDQCKLYYPLWNNKLWKLGSKFLPDTKYVIREPEDLSFKPDFLVSKKSLYYLGYWQSEKYFNDIRSEILKAYKFPEPEPNTKNSFLLEQIRNLNSISIHIRRGDYLKIKNTQNICNLDYYKKAIELIKEKINPDIFVFFSDDMEWCKENFKYLQQLFKVIFVDWNKKFESFRDMHLMSQCKHNIIANSSFSWWGAWLNTNPDKLVISPSKWMNDNRLKDIIPESWIKLSIEK